MIDKNEKDKYETIINLIKEIRQDLENFNQKRQL